MPNYRYQIRTTGGQVQNGVISADTAATASNILRNQGAHILSLSAGNALGDTDGLIAKLKEMNSGKPTLINAVIDPFSTVKLAPSTALMPP